MVALAPQPPWGSTPSPCHPKSSHPYPLKFWVPAQAKACRPTRVTSPSCPLGNAFKASGKLSLEVLVAVRRKHVPFLSDSFASLCCSRLGAQKAERRVMCACAVAHELGPGVERCRLSRADSGVEVAETYAWKRVSVAPIAANQVHFLPQHA